MTKRSEEEEVKYKSKARETRAQSSLITDAVYLSVCSFLGVGVGARLCSGVCFVMRPLMLWLFQVSGGGVALRRKQGQMFGCDLGATP